MNKEKRKESPFKEYLRFGVTGILNTGIDFLVLNLLLFAFSSTVEGAVYLLCKVVSFTAAVTQSYFLNKHWVFAGSSQNGKAADLEEGGKFLAVSIAGLLINITTSLIAFSILTQTGVDDTLAANMGAMVGTILVLLSNYAGYKFFVFKSSRN